MALNNLGLGFLFTAKDLASGVMGQVKKNFLEVHGATSAAGKAVGKAFKEFGTGLGLMGAGIAGLAVLSPAIDEATRFGKGIAEVSTLIDESKFSAQDMGRITRDMATTYGADHASEVKALYQGISAGAADAAAATSLLDAANRLAIGGVTDTSTAVDGLTNVMNAYSMDYANATSVSDAFFVAISKGKTTAAELGSTVGRLAPTAVSVGVGFQSMIGAISAVTTKGLKTEEAVSGLKAALANIINPTADAAKEATRLGIQFDQAALRSKGLPGFLDSITGSAQYNDETLSKLFGSIEAFNSIQALTANGSAAFKDILNAMGKSAGATDAAMAKMADTTAFLDTRQAALIKDAQITIGQALEPMTKAVKRFVNAVLDGFKALPGPVKKTLVLVFTGVSVFLAIAGAVIAAKAAFVLLAAAFSVVGVSVGTIWAALWPVALGIGVIALAVYGLKLAFDKNLGGIADTVQAMWKNVRLAFEGLRQLFADGGFSGDVMTELDKAENSGIKNFAINVFTWIERIKHFFGGIGDGLDAAFSKMGPTFAAFGAALEKLGKALGFLSKNEGADEAASTWDNLGVIGERVGNVIAAVIDMMVTGITWVIDFVNGLVSGWEGLNETGESTANIFDTVVGKFVELFAQFGLGTGAVVEGQSTMQRFGEVVMHVVQTVINIVLFLANILVTTLGGALSMAVSLFSGAFGMIVDLLNGFVDIFNGISLLFSGSWSGMWMGIKLIAFGVLQGLTNALLEFVGIFAGIADSVAGMFGGKTTMQADLRSFKESSAVEAAKSFGVAGATVQTVSPPAPTAPPTPGFNGAPANAAAGASIAQHEDLSKAMGAIAASNQSREPATLNATLVVDGEVMSRIVSKVSSSSSSARSFTPAPIPG